MAAPSVQLTSEPALPRLAPAWRVAGPLLLLGGVVATVPWALGARAPEFLGFLLAYSTPVFGKEVVIPVLMARGFDPLVAVLYLAAVDVLVCALLLLNLDRLHRVPWVGKALARVGERAARLMDRSRLFRRGALAGLLLYAAVPHKGGGGVGTGLLGSTMGMPKGQVVAVVAVGAVASGLVVANLAALALAMLGLA